MNKKGSLADSITGPITILIVGFTMIIAVFIFNAVSGFFLSMPLQANINGNGSAINNSIATAVNGLTPAFQTFDYMVPFLVGGLLIASTVLAFRRGASVVYIGFSLIFWALAMLLTSVFSNVFFTIVATPILVATNAQFPILNWIMGNLNIVVLGWLFILSVVMFTRNKREDQAISAAEATYM